MATHASILAWRIPWTEEPGAIQSAAAAAKLLQSSPTLCDPIDGSPPGSPSLVFSRQEHWSGLPFPSPWYSLWACKELDTTEQVHFHFHLLFIYAHIRYIRESFQPCPEPSRAVLSPPLYRRGIRRAELSLCLVRFLRFFKMGLAITNVIAVNIWKV